MLAALRPAEAPLSRHALATIVWAAAVLWGPSPAPAQDWTVLAQPTTRDLRKLSFLDARHGWAAGDSGTILVTTDGGGSWTAQSSPVDFHVVDIQMLEATLGWALAQQFPTPPTWEYGTTLIRTTDGGTNWFIQSTFNDIFVHALAFTGPQSGCLAGDQGKLWWTSDGGVSWTLGAVDSAASAQWPIHDVTFHTPTYGIATGGMYDVTGVVWRTTDGGRFWTHQRVAGEPLFATHFFDSLNIICVGGDLDYGAGMVRTSNAGVLWQYTYLGIWGRASAIAFRTATEGWAPLGFAGTYMKTRDGGDRWDAFPTPGDVAMHDVVFMDSGSGYMAGAGGIILKYVGEGSAVGAPEPVAGGSTLELRVGPNPFRTGTRIDFRVPRAGSVSLRIYDVGGREMARLVNETLPAGTYSRRLEGGGFPDGVYFCRLVAGDATETRKMHLVR